MIVAYDLRYADGHFTGVGTHAWLLLRALLELEGDERYVVLWTAPRKPRYEVKALASHPRVEWVERDIRTLHPAEPIALGAWLRERKPDVYFSPFYWLPLGAPCPCVLTIHDLWPLRYHRDLDPVRRAILRGILEVARRAALIITSSEFSRREIVELMRMPADRVRVARLGVAPRGQVVLQPRSRLPEGPFALVVGDNRPRKNLPLLAEAWARMGESPAVRLVGVGPMNPRFPSLAALAERSGARSVTELGWVEEGEMAWLYSNASCLVFPTLYEGFGLPLTEAFASGVPAIASDIPVLREIADGAARFVPPNDPETWRSAVLELASAPEERARLRAAGFRRASILTYLHTAVETLGHLREVVRGARTRPAGSRRSVARGSPGS